MGSNKPKGKAKAKKGKSQKKVARAPVAPPVVAPSHVRPAILCNPRLFPAMQAMVACCQPASEDALRQEHQLEHELRISNLLTAEWMPSTNKSFELLTGRVGRYTYYLYSRADKVICEDLYGAFCVVHATAESKSSSDVTAFVCMQKVGKYSCSPLALDAHTAWCLGRGLLCI